MAWMFWFPVFWILGEVVCSYSIALKWTKKVYKHYGSKQYAGDYFFNYYAKSIEDMMVAIGEAGNVTPMDILMGVVMWPTAISGLNQMGEEAYNRFVMEHYLEREDA